MKQKHLLATMKTCLLAAATGTLLFSSCAQDGFDDESFNGSGTVLELASPDANSIKVAASPDGKKQTISWTEIPGANRYQVSLYIKDDMENPVFADSIVKEAAVTADRLDDTFYLFKVTTLDNIPENNKSKGETTEKEFNTFVVPFATIDPSVNPEYADISKYFEENPIPDNAEESIEDDDKTLYFYLVGGQEYTMSSSINFGDHQVELQTFGKGKEGIATITMETGTNFIIMNKFGLNSIDIDASASDANFIKINTPSTEFLKKSDGSNSNYRSLSEIKIAQCNIFGITKSFINNGGGNICFDRIVVNNSIIEISGGTAMFALGNAFPKDLQITNSTLWSKEGHTNFLFQAQGRPKDVADGTTTWTIDHSTLYQIAKGKKMNNNNSGIKGQKTTTMVLTNSILVDTGSNTGNEVNGWLWGQNNSYNEDGSLKNGANVTYANNTYWANEAEAAGWTDSSKGGSDTSGTSLKDNPGFVDPANGDFTPTGAAQVANKTGDPRWYEEQ